MLSGFWTFTLAVSVSSRRKTRSCPCLGPAPPPRLVIYSLSVFLGPRIVLGTEAMGRVVHSVLGVTHRTGLRLG